MGGYSIYASCLDGTDNGVRFDQVMAEERGGENGWNVERCYMMKEDIDRVKPLLEREKGKER